MASPFPEAPLNAAGIVWFRRDDYAAVRRIMTDCDRLPQTYEAWLRGAEQAEKRVVANGFRAVRAFVDLVEFPAWCRANGVQCDSAGRGHFAAWVAYKTHQDGKL